MSQTPVSLTRPRQLTSLCGGEVGTRRSRLDKDFCDRHSLRTSDIEPVDNSLFPRVAFASFCLLSSRGGDDSGVGVGYVPRLISVEAVDGRLWAERRLPSRMMPIWCGIGPRPT